MSERGQTWGTRKLVDLLRDPAVLQLTGWAGVVGTFAVWAITGKAEPMFIVPCWALATGGKISSTLSELNGAEAGDRTPT